MNTPDITFNEAMRLHESGDLPNAISLYRSLLKKNGGDPSLNFMLGMAYVQNNECTIGIKHLNIVLTIHPDDISALVCRGIALRKLGQPKDAIKNFDRALAINPLVASIHSNRGNALRDCNKLEDACASYIKALDIEPNNLDALVNAGAVMNDLGRPEGALLFLTRAISLDPNDIEAHINIGNSLKKLRKYEEAIAAYSKSIALKPGYAEAHSNRGNVFLEANRLDEAVTDHNRAIALKPDYAEAYSNRGNVFLEAKRLNEAFADYNKAIALKPDYAEAYSNRGIVLYELKRLDDALADHNRAIALKPEYAEAYSNRGIVLHELKRLDDALADHNRAIGLKPGYAEAYTNRGIVLHELKRLDDALADHNKAIALKPDCALAYSNRGNVFHELKRLDDALADHNKAIALKPNCALAYSNRGAVLQELKQWDDACADYDKALLIDPTIDYLRGKKLHAQMHLCNWNDFESQLRDLVSLVEKGIKASVPFPLLALIDAPGTHKTASEIYVNDQYPASRRSVSVSKPHKYSKIKIGYFSADFHDHATMHLMAELFEKHDRSRFELLAFSLGPVTNDPWQLRAKNAFDLFIDCHRQSDAEISEIARNLGIDIAVDLKGFTHDARTGIFATRAAPIQVNFIGYPGTMGANFIDYVIGDTVLIPQDHQGFYTEKIAYLPDCYQPNCRTRLVSENLISRSDFGLPEEGIVFSSFNNNYKITPQVFACWMRILKVVEKSVLWLLSSNKTAEDNLRKYAEEHGIDPERIVFAKKLPVDEHLRRITLADMMLDTFPYGAHTTCSDALRMGLPVVTLKGESFASRVVASLVKTAGIPEFIVDSLACYEDFTIKLAKNRDQLADIRARLANGIVSAPIFNPDLFARNLESLYTAMYQKNQEGLPPENIFAS